MVRNVSHKAELAWALGLLLLVTALGIHMGCGRKNATEPRAGVVAPFVIHASNEVIKVECVERDEKTKTIRATVRIGEDGEVVRRVLITGGDEIPLPLGVAATLADDEDRILFSVWFGWDAGDNERVWLSEAAGGDRLIVSARFLPDHIVEEYRVNGQSLHVAYPRMEGLECRRAAALRSNGQEQWQPEDAATIEFLASLQRFREFYDGLSGNMLDNNPEGQVLVALISNEDFVRRVLGETARSTLMGLGPTVDHTCAVAGLCGLLKCMAGGFMNPLCVACAGTSAACAIAELGCWIANCESD